jgi:hypothetical protein
MSEQLSHTGSSSHSSRNIRTVFKVKKLPQGGKFRTEVKNTIFIVLLPRTGQTYTEFLRRWFQKKNNPKSPSRHEVTREEKSAFSSVAT